MSVISSRHTVVPFVSGKTQAFENQRLAKVGYKTTKKNPAKFASVAVSVPQINHTDVEESFSRLLPYICTMLETAQDGIIRSLYESSEGTRKEIDDEEISVNACVAFLEAEANGSRLRKETIESWFDSEVSENLQVMIAEKLGYTDITSDNQTTIDKHVKVYRDLIGMLAGGKTMLQEKQIKGCRVAISLANDDAGIADRLNARLTTMETKPKLEELLEL